MCLKGDILMSVYLCKTVAILSAILPKKNNSTNVINVMTMNIVCYKSVKNVGICQRL